MKKPFIIIAAALAVLIIALGVWWVLYLQKAHSSFANYYAFRGCAALLEKTDTYGRCRLASGAEIKLVKYQDKWFLDGDLPQGAKLEPATSTPVTALEYKNTDYGFSLALPAAWQGYAVVSEK